MGYGGKKKSVWQWVLIYIVIGLVIYGIIYYYFMMKNNGTTNMYQGATPTQEMMATVTPMVSIVPAATNVTMEKTNSAKVSYLTDLKGMTLYTFDNDQPSVSNCSGSCMTIWPPYKATSKTTTQSYMGIFTRQDGSIQYSWMGKPLYHYSKDAKAGDMLGDGVGGIWHIVKL